MTSTPRVRLAGGCSTGRLPWPRSAASSPSPHDAPLVSLADLETIVAEPWDNWGLIDSGNGQKWERYGPVTVVRPEPQAMWAPALEEWSSDATFVPGSDEEVGDAGSSIATFA